MIKKINKKIAVLGMVALSLSSLMAIGKKVDVKTLNNDPFISKKLKVTKAIDLGDVYQVKGIANTQHNLINAVITKDKKYIILGSVYELKTNKQVQIPVNMEHYKKKEAFTVGSGKDEYYVFTDPECPFCRNFEKVIPKIEEHIKFHVFMFPLSFHRHAKNMSLYILSQPKNKRAEAMKDIMVNNSNKYVGYKYTKEAQRILNSNMRIARELGVNGTPTLFNAKGKKISWVNLIKKYKVQMDVDPRAIRFLQKQKIPLSLSFDKKKDLFVFLDIKEDKKFINNNGIEKLLKKYNVNLVLFPKDKEDLPKTMFIYKSDNPLKALHKYANEKLTLTQKKASITLLKDKKLSRRVMTGLYISQRLNIVKTPLVVDKYGKIFKQ